MSEENDKDLERTQELYDFLQGKMPEGTHVARSHRPNLPPAQAWTVIWYLGNQYWQVTDRVEKCCVCDSCMDGEEYARKSKSRLNPDNIKLTPLEASNGQTHSKTS